MGAVNLLPAAERAVTKRDQFGFARRINEIYRRCTRRFFLALEISSCLRTVRVPPINNLKKTIAAFEN